VMVGRRDVVKTAGRTAGTLIMRHVLHLAPFVTTIYIQ
jgi:hypothetical protein